MRAASTVVDVSVFLLLVGVAMGTLALADTGPPPAGPDETAVLFASSTTEATYETVSPGYYADEPAVQDTEATRNVTVHGTYAGLAGRAALANLSLADGERLWSNPRFSRSVADAIETLVDRRPGRFQVRVTWTPYPGAPVMGRETFGHAPPPGVDVTATTLTAPAHLDSAVPADLGSNDGFDAVAAFVAGRTVEGVFETDRGVARPVAPSSIDEARSELETALREDMADRFDSPAAARDALDFGAITVTIRGWDP